MSSNGHGAGIALNRDGNEGWASVSEADDGTITLSVGGTLETLNRVTIEIGPREPQP